MRRQSFPRKLAVSCFSLVAMVAAATAQTAELYLADDTPFDQGPAVPEKRLPLLFVHGHNETDQDTDFNYRKNWQDSLNGLPSFKRTLDSAANSALGIEPYYIRFRNQARSITEDAAEISNAVERILLRHDPNYHYPDRPTHVQIVIIAYSKGTISTRQYLKSLQVEVPGLPPPRPGFRPVSEFIAIAPPNHGLATRVFATTSDLSVKQLYNGYRPRTIVNDRCGTSFGTSGATDYIETLNRRDSADLHVIEDTQNLGFSQVYAGEAPGSRPATLLAPNGLPAPTAPTAGTLYVTLFDSDDRDIVGGDVDSDDCQGRAVASNLAPDAENIPVPGITDSGWETVLGSAGALFNEQEKKAVAVHQNTVHTPEVICQALYAAVHHRSPRGQTCTSDINGVPVIPPPSRAAAMLALDFSGSMSARACPGCPTRAAVLKDAVELFVQLWSAVSVPSDRMGVNYFSTNVTSSAINGGAPELISAGTANIIAEVGAQNPGGSTAMGGGLQQAIQKLSDPSLTAELRRVILFTDGMQNVNVMARVVNDQLTFVNEPGHPATNPPGTPMVLDPSLGIAVDTIGVGAGETFVDLLGDIATATRGRTTVTTDINEDLRRFFVDELINALKGFSPQLIAYRRNIISSAGSRNENFSIDGGSHRVVLKLSWQRGESMDFTVRKDGVDVTGAGHFINGAFYKIFVIDLPAKKGGGPVNARGSWQLRIKGKAATPYETAAIVDGGRITYDAVFTAKRPKVGDPLDLVVRSTADGKPIGAGARVTATLTMPTTAIRDLLATKPSKDLPAFEPNTPETERHLLALAEDPKTWAKLKPKQKTVILRRSGKAAFRTRLHPQIPGIYMAVVTIEGEAAKLGKFARTATTTVVVTEARRP
jgi:hypothetical protein